MTALIKIETLTKKGRDALEFQEKERSKMGFIEKLSFNKMFDVLIVGDFKICEIRFKHSEIVKYLNPAGLLEKIQQGFKESGAVENKDYKISLEGF